ncbi:MAG: LCP family protein [Acidimicrobiia bacterium]
MSSVTETFPEIPRVQVPPPGQKPKRRWSRAQKFFLFLLGFTAVAVFAGYGFLRYTESRIDRIAAADVASLAPVTASGAPINFLLVGVDDRSSIPDDWDDTFGDFAGRRTDVIMLAHLIPGETIQMLSIPRDWRTEIPGHGTNRINATYVIGGPDLLIQSVQSETGIPVNHYVEIDFGGVGKVVDSLGGVTLDFDYPGRDLTSGFRVEAGRQTLDGEQAVAYARSRKYQELRNGEWTSARGGDIARTGRQQQILIALFNQATSPSSAFNLTSFLPTFASQISADEGLTLARMADLGRTALSLESRSIDAATLPVRDARGSDGRSYVVPVETTQSYIDAFLAGVPFPRE